MATYESATREYYTLKLDVSETGTSTENNTSTLSWKLYLTSGATYFSEIRIGAKVVIDGKTAVNRGYAASSYYSLSRNSSVTLASGTLTVAHAADGTKTIAAGAITASISTQTGNIVPTLSLSNGTSLPLSPIPRKSTISVTGSQVLGGTRTITITRASGSFTHTLTYTYGSASGTIATKTASTSVSWVMPKSLAAQVAAGSTSRTGTITCVTYNGSTKIGESTASFSGSIPASAAAISAASGVMGTARTVTITRAASNLTHTLTYSFGSATGTIATKSTGTSVSWTVPKSLAAQVASGSVSRSGTITVETFNGSASCGTSTVSFSASIPASTASFPADAVLIGSSQKITISRAAANITHDITYSFGGISGESVGTGIGTEKSWTLPAKMAAEVAAGSIQRTGSIKVTTKNGSAVIGSVTLTFTAKIPPSELSVSGTAVTLGSTKSISFTPVYTAAPNLKHKLGYTIGTSTGTIASEATSPTVWTVPKALAAKIPSGATGSVTVTLTTYNGSAAVGNRTKTFSVTIPPSTIANAAFTIGTEGSFAITRAASTLTHKITYTFGGNSYTAISSTDSASPAWTPPMARCNLLPDAVSGTGTVTLTTYNGGTQVGSAQTATLTLKVPASVKPTVNAFQRSIRNTANSTIAGWGIAVKGYTTVRFTVDAEGQYGASIVSRKVTFSNQSGQAALSSGAYIWETGKLSRSGTISATLEVTDSRGRKTTQTGTAVTVYDYQKPVIKTAAAFRSDETGTKDRQGSYAAVKLSGSVTSLGSRNTATLKARYRAVTASTWSGETTLQNNTQKVINWNLSYLTAYVAELSITDTVGEVTTKTFSLPADQVTLHLRRGGMGVGIGTYSLIENRLTIHPGWNVTGRVYSLGALIPAASGDDFNNYIVPGRYGVISSDVAGSLVNCPSSDSGTLTVEASTGKAEAEWDGSSNLFLIQTYKTYNNGEEWRRYVRYYNGAWAYNSWRRIWPVENASQVSLTYVSNSAFSSLSGFTLQKSGPLCVLSVNAAPAAVAVTSFTTIGTIPEGARPSAAVVQNTNAQNSTTFVEVAIRLGSDGNIQLYSPGTQTSRIQMVIPYFTNV